jgi:hypothetical protein
MRLKEQGLGRVIRIGDSAQASDIRQISTLSLRRGSDTAGTNTNPS